MKIKTKIITGLVSIILNVSSCTKQEIEPKPPKKGTYVSELKVKNKKGLFICFPHNIFEKRVGLTSQETGNVYSLYTGFGVTSEDSIILESYSAVTRHFEGCTGNSLEMEVKGIPLWQGSNKTIYDVISFTLKDKKYTRFSTN